MFPDRQYEITLHRKNAYKFFKEKNYDMARKSFMKWVESVRQQNINTDGQLEDDLNKAKKEYSDFVKNDPLYISICNQIIPKIEEHPGILQTDLYKVFSNINRSDISYTLYFAADHNRIKRVKKGRTYSLYL